ncbi:hypothetical protein [Streptosporangium amethystogenes]|uniref:hypothetical protein n=1 Tax=Streptosporangium amethystogenes TaxID=2002 RepID=UPI0004C4E175|nr:hypothetical protein [Streptosporangium amethystogenes]
MDMPCTPASALRKAGLVFVLACQTLALGACGRQAYWDQIAVATVSADELTITAEMTIGPPKADGTSCYEVVEKKVEEFTSQVIIGIQMRNNCAPVFPWEQEVTTLVGYPLKVDLPLKAPLAGRSILDEKSGERVSVIDGNGS